MKSQLRKQGSTLSESDSVLSCFQSEDGQNSGSLVAPPGSSGGPPSSSASAAASGLRVYTAAHQPASNALEAALRASLNSSLSRTGTGSPNSRGNASARPSSAGRKFPSRSSTAPKNPAVPGSQAGPRLGTQGSGGLASRSTLPPRTASLLADVAEIALGEHGRGGNLNRSKSQRDAGFSKAAAERSLSKTAALLGIRGPSSSSRNPTRKTVGGAYPNSGGVGVGVGMGLSRGSVPTETSRSGKEGRGGGSSSRNPLLSSTFGRGDSLDRPQVQQPGRSTKGSTASLEAQSRSPQSGSRVAAATAVAPKFDDQNTQSSDLDLDSLSTSSGQHEGAETTTLEHRTRDVLTSGESTDGAEQSVESLNEESSASDTEEGSAEEGGARAGSGLRQKRLTMKDILTSDGTSSQGSSASGSGSGSGSEEATENDEEESEEAFDEDQVAGPSDSRLGVTYGTDAQEKWDGDVTEITGNTELGRTSVLEASGWYAGGPGGESAVDDSTTFNDGENLLIKQLKHKFFKHWTSLDDLPIENTGLLDDPDVREEFERIRAQAYMDLDEAWHTCKQISSKLMTDYDLLDRSLQQLAELQARNQELEKELDVAKQEQKTSVVYWKKQAKNAMADRDRAEAERLELLNAKNAAQPRADGGEDKYSTEELWEKYNEETSRLKAERADLKRALEDTKTELRAAAERIAQLQDDDAQEKYEGLKSRYVATCTHLTQAQKQNAEYIEEIRQKDDQIQNLIDRKAENERKLEELTRLLGTESSSERPQDLNATMGGNLFEELKDQLKSSPFLLPIAEAPEPKEFSVKLVEVAHIPSARQELHRTSISETYTPPTKPEVDIIHHVVNVEIPSAPRVLSSQAEVVRMELENEVPPPPAPQVIKLAEPVERTVVESIRTNIQPITTTLETQPDGQVHIHLHQHYHTHKHSHAHHHDHYHSYPIVASVETPNGLLPVSIGAAQMQASVNQQAAGAEEVKWAKVKLLGKTDQAETLKKETTVPVNNKAKALLETPAPVDAGQTAAAAGSPEKVEPVALHTGQSYLMPKWPKVLTEDLKSGALTSDLHAADVELTQAHNQVLASLIKKPPGEDSKTVTYTKKHSSHLRKSTEKPEVAKASLGAHLDTEINAAA